MRNRVGRLQLLSLIILSKFFSISLYSKVKVTRINKEIKYGQDFWVKQN